jgi:kynurenine formamidase
MNATRPIRITDLTLALRPGMPGVDGELVRTLETDGWNARLLRLYSHAGTHMDAQTHFGAGGETVDAIPLVRCMGPAWVVDLRAMQPGDLILPQHLGPIADAFPAGESLLLCTHWDRYQDNEALYRGKLPRVSAALARWCVERKVRLLGVETPSVADVNNLEELTEVHRILLGGGVVIVEGLTHLDALVGRRVLFMALPLKIQGGDGSPCRALAVEGVLDGAPREVVQA